MCGICGIVMMPGIADKSVIHEMAEQIVHRGPDDEGIVALGRAGIGARRLSIIDVAGGHQPISNEGGTVWCALTGEIYNFPDLMADLRSRGHTFQTHCDTEVIVHLYEEYGARCLERLDGMFAVAIWDLGNDSVLLARDRLGIKPLYFAELGDRLLFGSELKALLPAGLPTGIDGAALKAYFTLGYIPAPYTIYSAARKLRPGHYLMQEGGRSAVERPYWELPVASGGTTGRAPSTQELSEELLRLLRLAVKRHMISDVPLGAFLSGGLDSSTVVALMAEYSSTPVKTFSIGFDERSYDETPHARSVAQLFGTDHQELVQKPDPVLLIETLSHFYDEPFADSSALATYSVAALTRKHVTVALTGDGGDEVFGGYLLYRADKLAGLYRQLPRFLRDGLVPHAAAMLPSSDRKTSFDYKVKRFVRAASSPPAEAHAGWKALFTPEARETLLAANGHGDPALDLVTKYYQSGPAGDPIGRSMHLDTLLSLPDDMLTKVDRATMAVSLEARVPLLDRSIVEFMAGLPSSLKVHGWTLKYLLKKAVTGVVPDSIIHRKKEGFSIPISLWLREDLRDLMLDSLSSSNLKASGLLDERTVADTIDQHLSRRSDRGRELWSLLTFALWYERYANPSRGVDNLAVSAIG